MTSQLAVKQWFQQVIEQLDNAIVAILFLLAVLGFVQAVGVEQHYTAAGQVHLFAYIFQVGP